MASGGKQKSALDFSVQYASAALPRNCQTTNWILGGRPIGVNVTLVMGLAARPERDEGLEASHGYSFFQD